MMGAIPLTPALLVATANAFVGLGEVRGQWPWTPQGELVESFLKEVRAADRFDVTDGASELVPWDAAFVHHAGYWSHYDQRGGNSSWPLPATASVEELAQYAGISGALRTTPLFGDLFLQWSPARREFVRTGIVAYVEQYVRTDRNELIYPCITVEGNSALAGAATGTLVLRQYRQFIPSIGDQFIRWPALDGREARLSTMERWLDETGKSQRAA